MCCCKLAVWYCVGIVRSYWFVLMVVFDCGLVLLILCWLLWVSWFVCMVLVCMVIRCCLPFASGSVVVVW